MEGYRLIEFSHSGIKISYPDDQDLFRKTKFYPSVGKVIGWYKGADTSIVAYTGPWPNVVQEYQKDGLSFKDVASLFSADEYVACKELAKTDTTVDQLFDIAKNTSPLSMDDPMMIGGLNYIASRYDANAGYPLDTIPDQASADTILKGMPI